MDTINNEKILITGSSGFIGKHVVKLAKDAGRAIHTLSTTEYHDENHHVIDLQDTDALQQLIIELQPTGIIHLAAAGLQYQSQDMAYILKINVNAFQMLLEACRSLQKPPVILAAGSWFEYESKQEALSENDALGSLHPYSITKIAAYHIARYYAQFMPLTWLRLFSIYGPNEPSHRLMPSVIEAALKGQAVDLSAGEQIRDYIYVEDVADVIWQLFDTAVLENSLRVLNIGTGRAISLRTLLETLQVELDKYSLRTQLNFGAKPYRSGENMFAVADISRLEALLNWKPRTSLQQGIQQTVQTFMRLDDESR